MKKLAITLLTAALLAGCNDATHQDVQTTQPPFETQAISQTPEELSAHFKQSPLFEQQTTSVETYFTQAVDFQGDKVPEMVVATSTDDVKVSELAIYQLEQDTWQEMKRLTYDTHLAISLEPLATLAYEDSPKEALAFKKIEAFATTMGETVIALDYNDSFYDFRTIAKIDVQTGETVEAPATSNTIHIQSAAATTDYIFNNGRFVDQEGKPFGILLDEQVAAFVGTTINQHMLTTTDDYYLATQKIEEPLLNEGFMRGSTCADYATFQVCDTGTAPNMYIVNPANDLTAQDISKFFDQPVQLVEAENLLYMDGPSYTGQVVTASGMYTFEFDGPTLDATLQGILVHVNE